VRIVATRGLLTSFRGVVPPSLVSFPRVVTACASANARPTTWILGGPARPVRWSREARTAMHECMSFVCSIRQLRRVSSSRSPPSMLRCGRPLLIALPKQGFFGPAVPPAWVSFRPRGFSPPRRLPPSARCGHCCSPLPILGFTVFPDPSAVPALPKEAFQPVGAVPHDALTPRRCSLSAAPASSPRHPEGSRVHGRRCPPAVSSVSSPPV
jgi:hypothetical protein